MAASDDDDAVEGSIARGLFRTDSDSEGDDEDRADRPATTTPEETIIQHEVMHVRVEEKRLGGSIAQRLWPAAEYLANFIIDFATLLDNDDEDNLLERSSLRQLLSQLHEDGSCLPVIELGAGIGLTGLELATQLPLKVLLTDLDEALPLLRGNVALNRDRFRLGPSAVTVQKLAWGDQDEAEKALEWYRSVVSSNQSPLLLIGSDCVYWEDLHGPLETCLAQLLSQAPPGSMCLLAGMRRWKRDNSFYQSLGKRTRTPTHELRCISVQETVKRRTDAGNREIMRVYAITWVKRQTKSKVAS